jgi:hypothetical protein
MVSGEAVYVVNMIFSVWAFNPSCHALYVDYAIWGKLVKVG